VGGKEKEKKTITDIKNLSKNLIRLTLLVRQLSDC